MSTATAAPRSGARAHGTLASVEIDHRRRRASVKGVELYLSDGEFRLLAALAKEPARILTYKDLLEETFAGAPGGSRRTIDSHAARLRRKLELRGMPNMITRFHQLGFRFSEDSQPVVAGGGA